MKTAVIITLVLCLGISVFSAWTAWDSRNALDALCAEYVSRWKDHEMQKERESLALTGIEKALKRLNKQNGGNGK